MSSNNTDTTVIVDGHKVSCDGGGGALGHPLVWMEMGKEGEVVCKYCDKRFIQLGGPKDPEVLAKSG